MPSPPERVQPAHGLRSDTGTVAEAKVHKALPTGEADPGILLADVECCPSREPLY